MICSLMHVSLRSIGCLLALEKCSLYVCNTMCVGNGERNLFDRNNIIYQPIHSAVINLVLLVHSLAEMEGKDND